MCATDRKKDRKLCGDVIYFMATAPHYGGLTLRKKRYFMDEGVDSQIVSSILYNVGICKVW